MFASREVKSIGKLNWQEVELYDRSTLPDSIRAAGA